MRQPRCAISPASWAIPGPVSYNAVGDKRTLYRRSLDHYLDRSVRERVDRLENSLSPREAIATFLQEIIERSLSDKQRRGRMLVNSALELAPHDLEFQRVVARAFAEIEAFFRQCVVAGQRDGTIAPQPADDLARLFLGIVLGIRVLARAKPERALLETPRPSGAGLVAARRKEGCAALARDWSRLRSIPARSAAARWSALRDSIVAVDLNCSPDLQNRRLISFTPLDPPVEPLRMQKKRMKRRSRTATPCFSTSKPDNDAN
jgi:TetR/AcrR family transcriptional regulator, transcriptional repressor for nem operon